MLENANRERIRAHLVEHPKATIREIMSACSISSTSVVSHHLKMLRKAEVKDALAFKTGYLIACCNLVNLHDQPGLAFDVLAEAGIHVSELETMDLCDFDIKALDQIRRWRPSKGDPISNA